VNGDGIGLCVRADFEAEKRQPSNHFDRCKKLHLTIEIAFFQMNVMPWYLYVF
jgi:hypothetical protein